MVRASRFSLFMSLIAVTAPLFALCPDFTLPAAISAGTSPSGIATGDFDRDGLLDLAVANATSGNVSILLANGSGGFNAAASITVGTAPVALLAADFNRDARVDLAIVNSGSASVSVADGDGFGGFGTPATYPAGTGARAITAADFDLDGSLDLAVANATANTVSVLSGSAFGSFTAAGTLATGTNPRDLVAADFDGDGDPDLAVANRDSNTVTLHAGAGDGTFAVATPFAIPAHPPAATAAPSAIAAGDFDRNGTMDLAVTAELSNSVAILAGNGAGSFGTATTIAVGTKPQSVRTADVTFDGSLDLLVGNRDADTISVLPGNGTGGFAAAINYPAGDEPVALAVADIDGDAKPDVIAANIAANQVSLLLGNGACLANCATFAAHLPVGSSGTGSAVATGDFDNDGMPDLAIASESANTVLLFPGDGAGGFAAANTSFTGSSPKGLAAADVNRDGNLDLAVANFSSDSVTIHLGDGLGGFALPTDVALGIGTGPRAITAGDFDGNGTIDFAVTGGSADTLVILLNNTSIGSGFPSFSANTTSSVGSGQGPRGIATGDLNLDGALDLVIANFGDGVTAGSVLLFEGDGNGSFSSAGSFGTSIGTEAVALADFDGDGDLDIAAANRSSASVTLALRSSGGSFSVSGTISAGSTPVSIAVFDANLDGMLDLAVANEGASNVSMFLGNGTGNFASASPPTHSVGASPAALATGDFNRDGKVDLVAATSGGSHIGSILLNGCPPPDLAIEKSHPAAFQQGGTGTYFINVSNLASVASAGKVTVVDTLPAGLTATEINGMGWDCTLSPLRCSRSDSLDGGSAFPSINIAVSIATNAPPTVTNYATLYGGADVSTSNNTASDITTIVQRPDLLITKTHAGNFSQGQNGAAYTITVSNGGGAASAGFISVVDTLPAGLTATSMSGTGWSCTLASLTCTRSDTLASGGSFPAITLLVDVAPTAASSLTNVASVSGGSDGFTANNTASDPTTITPRADLTVAKSHIGSFSQGQTGAVYTIVVSNIGGAATTGTVSVVDTLPTGLTATTMSGSGWTCSPGTRTCTRADALAPAASYPAITLTVSVAADASSPLVNSVTVSGGGEAGTLNSSDTDSTVIKRVVPSCGKFAPPISLTPAGIGDPRAVTTGDFNGDGDLDVAYVTDNSGNLLAVTLGNGDGTFDAPVTLATGSGPNAPITGDFDSDGTLDLALVNISSGTVSVYLGHGDGTFAAAVNYATGNVPYAVASGYFNADAHLDLVVANNNSANVSVLLGSSTGAFAAPVTYATAPYPLVVEVSDFNEDGKADLAVAGNFGLSILAGVGDGTFGAADNSSLVADPRGIVVEDFDHDGHRDLAVADLGGNKVSVILGNGDGTFDAKTDFATPVGTFWLESDDFDGDGNADFVVAHHTGIAVLFGSGTGSFAAAVTNPVGDDTYGVATGDFNGDSRPDIVTANGTSKTISIVLNACIDIRVAKTHTGNFTQGQTGATYSIVVSNADLITSNGTVTVTDVLPPQLTATAISGSGWTCTLATLTCTRSNALAGGASHPPITVTVNVHSNAPASITNTATVSGGADDFPGNNTANDQTTVIAASMIAPTRLVAIAQSTSHIYLTWDGVTDAVTYKIFRRSLGGPFTEIANVAAGSFTDYGRSSGVTYVYQVRAVNSAALAGPPSINDLATTSFFTDDTLSPAIKAIHFTELRTAINAVRAAAGLGAAAYTNAIAAGGIVRAVDLTEMRTALNAARTALAVPAISYTDPSITTSTMIKAAHIQDLRSGTR